MLMPNLRSLDGRAVTEEEHFLAEQAVERERAYLAVLLTNACAVHKMVRLWPLVCSLITGHITFW